MPSPYHPDLTDRKSLLSLLAFYSPRKNLPQNSHFGASSKEKEVLEKLLSPLEKILSATPTIFYSPEDNLWRFRLYSAKLQELFLGHLSEGTALPWKLLQAQEDKERYFSWYFLRNGSVGIEYNQNKNSFRISFCFRNNPGLGEEFAVLLFQLGMLPRHGKTKVDLHDLPDLKKAAELCIGNAKQKVLESYLKGKSEPERVPPPVILELIAKLENGTLARREGRKILEQYHLPLARLDQWRYTGKLPHHVQRYLRLKELETNLFKKIGHQNSLEMVEVEHFFNRFIPERYFRDKMTIRACYSQYYRILEEKAIETKEIGGKSYLTKPEAESLEALFLPMILPFERAPHSWEKAKGMAERAVKGSG